MDIFLNDFFEVNPPYNQSGSHGQVLPKYLRKMNILCKFLVNMNLQKVGK